MKKIENGSIIELAIDSHCNHTEFLYKDNGTKVMEHDIIMKQETTYKYVVMGYHGNGITIIPLEDYKNKIFKNFKYTLFIFLQKVKVVGKIKDDDFNLVLLKAKLCVPYLRQLKAVNIKIYDKKEKRNLDYENTEVALIDAFGYCWQIVRSEEEIQKYNKKWTNIISVRR